MNWTQRREGREGRKDAIIAPLFPIFYPAIPDFHPVIPAFPYRHSRESGNPDTNQDS